MTHKLRRENFSSSFTMERFLTEVNVPGIHVGRTKHNLLSFLATAQALHLQFLPITWQSGCLGIGAGQTSDINEALADLHISFAFKRVEESRRLKGAEEEVFRVFTNEITILSYLSIREHPYIAQLQGLCWDIAADGMVWPVLLFEKSQLGDLYHFLKTPLGKQLDAHERIQLCVDIERAISDMHSYNIIHGDLKPQNVLVFQDSTREYVAKVIDFGYSTRYTEDKPMIQVPRSIPWNAPEHTRNNRMWTPSEAKKLDYFSLGLLCLWILFEEYLECSGGPDTFLTELKQAGTLVTFAQKQLETSEAFNDETKRALQDLFNSTLTHDQAKRELKGGNLFNRQFQGHSLHDEFREMDFCLSDADFKLEASIGELYTCDFRVRSYIATCLQESFNSASESSEANSTANVAFQVALCYKLGFGVSRDENKLAEALQQSDQGEIDMTSIMAYWEEKERSRFRAPAIQNAREQDHLQSTNFGIRYLEENVLTQAESQLLQDIVSLELSLGAENQIVLFVKNALASVYRAQGRWKEGEVLLKEAMDLSVKVRGKEDISTLAIMSHLALMLKNQWRTSEAEALEKKMVKLSVRTLGSEHAFTLASITCLIQTHILQGRWKEAERKEKRIVKIKKKTLGKEHPSTLTSVCNLILLLRQRGRFKKAEERAEKVFETSIKVFGTKHGFAARCEGILGSCLWEQGRWKDAEEKFINALKTMETVYGTESSFILSSIANLATTKSFQGQWKMAEELRVRAFEISKRSLGNEHPTTLSHMNNLASTFYDQGRWKEAESLLRQAVESNTRNLGKEDQETISVVAALASVIRCQGRWDESEKLEKEVLELSTKILGKENPTTIDYAANLASTMWHQRRLDEAEELFIEVIKGRERLLGPEHPNTIVSVMDLGATLWQAGRLDEAESLFLRGVAVRKKELGPEHPETLDGLAKLAFTFRKQGRQKEAEDMEIHVMTVRTRVLGAEHPNTSVHKFNLAMMYSKQGRQEEAVQLMEDFVTLAEKVRGDEHPLTIGAKKTLKSWEIARRELEEANLPPQDELLRALSLR